MANPTVRLIVGVIVGMIVAGLIVFAVELLGHSIYPPPADIEVTDPADLARLIAVMPFEAKLFVVVGWFLGAIGGAFVANRIARSHRAGWIVAVIVILLSTYSLVTIPHPIWMIIAAVALPLMAAWIASRQVTRAPTM